jgi:hypothetical protein
MVKRNIPPLPDEIKEVVEAYLAGLHRILIEKLYGVYMYGASVFPDTGPIQDIDCHVIIRKKLTEAECTALMTAYQELAEKYPYLGSELDAYVILLDDAKGHEIPQHQIIPTIYDHAWALHCAHIRAGYYRVLRGPEPTEIFPEPTWEAIDTALQHELQFVIEHLQYPAYCILNLCRILYSYREENPVVSKQFSGHWGIKRFPQWEKLIEAAKRFYLKSHSPEDEILLSVKIEDFLGFMIKQIDDSRKLN